MTEDGQAPVPPRPDPDAPHSRSGFHLLDLVALVVGYSLASLLARAFWPSAGAESPLVVVFLLLEYLWLGLAMSGPVVLLIRRRGTAEAAEPRTWAELAWLIIGFYWIGLAVLVVPIRMPETKLLDAAILGAFPVAAAVVLRFLSPKHLDPTPATPLWTHRAAIGLLVSWPFAWAILILLGKTL